MPLSTEFKSTNSDRKSFQLSSAHEHWAKCHVQPCVISRCHLEIVPTELDKLCTLYTYNKHTLCISSKVQNQEMYCTNLWYKLIFMFSVCSDTVLLSVAVFFVVIWKFEKCSPVSRTNHSIVAVVVVGGEKNNKRTLCTHLPFRNSEWKMIRIHSVNDFNKDGRLVCPGIKIQNAL